MFINLHKCCSIIRYSYFKNKFFQAFLKMGVIESKDHIKLKEKKRKKNLKIWCSIVADAGSIIRQGHEDLLEI